MHFASVSKQFLADTFYCKVRIFPVRTPVIITLTMALTSFNGLLFGTR